MTPLEERFRTPVTGPAYRMPAKVFVVLTLVFMVFFAARNLDQMAALPWAMWVLLAAAFGGVVITSWYVVTGNTTVDSAGVHQQWMVEKSYRWDQIKRARHVRLPLASRLMISVGFGPAKAIHSGSAEIDAAFKEIAAYYRAKALGQIP